MRAVAVIAALALAAVPAPAYASPPLAWGACPSAPAPQECAAVSVPLDYRRPDGPRIAVEISRIPAADPALRRGVLVLNSGGPGGSGLDLPSRLGPLLPAEVRDRFDLIGFDPRGVGSSTPVTCGLDPGTPLDLLQPYPAADGSIDRNVAFARAAAEGCAARSGDLMPYVTTANRARDLDRIRRALGEAKLSYLGYSYGSYLGTVFATLFPQAGDRIVLDSAIDPEQIWYDLFRSQGPAVEQRLADFARWAAPEDPAYHLGPTPEAVEATFASLASRLDESPVALPNGVTVNGNVFRELTRNALYGDQNFPALARTWVTLMTATAVASARAASGVPSDNATAAQYAVLCDDVAWPRDITVYARNTALSRRLFPATAGMPANVWPCAFWATRPLEPPVTVTGRGPRNILILQNRRDPVTPWASGLGLRRALGHRAALLTAEQGGHGVYLLSPDPCAAAAATAFLTEGTLPGADPDCPAALSP